MKNTFFLLFFTILLSSSINAQSKKEEKKAKAQKEFEATKKLVESEDFEFQADWATPASGRRVSLTTNPNFLKYSKDSVDIYLPYFGQITGGGASLTGDGGIVCNGPRNKYKMTVDDKKQKIIIDFEVSNKDDTFKFNMQVYKSGSTFINVNSNFRNTISYDGKIKSPPPPKK